MSDVSEASEVEPSATAADAGPGLLGWVARTTTALSGVCLVVIIVCFGWQVFGRYILNATPTWTEQLGLLLIVYISFLSAAVGVREDTHLGVSVLRDVLPPSGRMMMDTLADLVMICFGAALAFYGWSLAEFSIPTKIPLLNISEAWRIAPVVIGGAMISLFSLVRIIKRLSVSNGRR
ncbi:MAG: TRAP transporter small permease [Rhodobacteraceae bacterium]|nr:TRAP transporter small permease [Paracoccaceae bacterium]